MSVFVPCVRGQFGWTASQGVDALCIQIRQIPNVTAAIYNWNQQQAIVNAIRAQYRQTRIAYVGYSLGATYGPRVCRIAARSIDLLIGLDPSQSYLVGKVPTNVRKAIAFYNPNAWYWGGVQYKGENVENIAITGNIHLGIDWDNRCWKRTLDEIRALTVEA